MSDRGEERDTTMHLIRIQVLTHSSRVTELSLHEVCTYMYSTVGVRAKLGWELFEIPETPLGLDGLSVGIGQPAQSHHADCRPK